MAAFLIPIDANKQKKIVKVISLFNIS